MAKKVDLKKYSVASFEHPDDVDTPGLYIVEGEPVEDENGVKHETNMKPGDRVYASPDGEGFVYDDPAEGSEE